MSVLADDSILPDELAEMQRLIDARSDEVLNSWQMLYDRQRDILTWPVDELKQDFVDELGLTFDILLDPEAEVQRLYLVRGYPTSVIIDPEGIMRVQHIGLMTEDQLDGYLQEIRLP